MAEPAATPVASSSSVRMYPVASLISLERTNNVNANKGLKKEKGNTLKKEKICVQIAANQQFPTEYFPVQSNMAQYNQLHLNAPELKL